MSLSTVVDDPPTSVLDGITSDNLFNILYEWDGLRLRATNP